MQRVEGTEICRTGACEGATYSECIPNHDGRPEVRSPAFHEEVGPGPRQSSHDSCHSLRSSENGILYYTYSLTDLQSESYIPTTKQLCPTWPDYPGLSLTAANFLTSMTWLDIQLIALGRRSPGPTINYPFLLSHQAGRRTVPSHIGCGGLENPFPCP